MEITYQTGIVPKTEEVIDLYNSSGIKRPTANYERTSRMYSNANLIITAWHGEQLVGVARSLTDFCYCCYLSDLAVRMEYQKQGIGRELIRLTQVAIGEQTMLLLLSAPNAMDYYPKLGFEKVENGYIIHRKK
jgi:N-acetylglutamate synthase-like GNAT family acetyltransferase